MWLPLAINLGLGLVKFLFHFSHSEHDFCLSYFSICGFLDLSDSIHFCLNLVKSSPSRHLLFLHADSGQLQCHCVFVLSLADEELFHLLINLLFGPLFLNEKVELLLSLHLVVDLANDARLINEFEKFPPVFGT